MEGKGLTLEKNKDAVEGKGLSLEKLQVFQSEFDLWIKFGGGEGEGTNWSQLQLSSSAKLEERRATDITFSVYDSRMKI